MYKVSLDIKIEKNPLRRAKKMTITSETEIWHLSDYESNDDFHIDQFKKTIDKMKEAKNIGKNIIYQFGYSNFTFDLWIILHKDKCKGPKNHRTQYLYLINKALNESFISMDDYKHEDNFKRCLKQLDLKNVKDVIERAKDIMKNNELNGYVLQKYKGYSFYRENPSLMIWKIIEKIMDDCHLL